MKLLRVYFPGNLRARLARMPADLQLEIGNRLENLACLLAQGFAADLHVHVQHEEGRLAVTVNQVRIGFSVDTLAGILLVHSLEELPPSPAGRTAGSSADSSQSER